MSLASLPSLPVLAPRDYCPQKQNCQHPYCNCFPGSSPAPAPALGGGPESCGNGENCVYPDCACPFMPGPGDKDA